MMTLHADGNLGRDPQQITNSNGTVFVQFSIAHTKLYQVTSNGGATAETTWLNCKVTTRNAQLAAKCMNLQKGQHVTVTGEMSVRAWSREDGSLATQVDLFLSDVATDEDLG